MIFNLSNFKNFFSGHEVTELDIEIVNLCSRSGKSRGVVVTALFAGDVLLFEHQFFESPEALKECCPTVDSLLQLFADCDGWSGPDEGDEERVLLMSSFEDSSETYAMPDMNRNAPYIFYGVHDVSVSVPKPKLKLEKVKSVNFKKNKITGSFESTSLDISIDWKKNKDNKILGLVVRADYHADISISDQYVFSSEAELLEQFPTLPDLLSLFKDHEAWRYSVFRQYECALFMNSLTGADDLYDCDKKVQPFIIYGDGYYKDGQKCLVE